MTSRPAPPTVARARRTRRLWTGVPAVAVVLLGLWIALAPFHRPLAGGAAFSLEATPQVGCRTPVVGMMGDDRPTAEVHTTPRPAEGDPTVLREVDCTGRARFRVALGASLLVLGLLGLAVTRRRTPDRSPP